MSIITGSFARLASATAPSFPYMSSPVPTALPLCSRLHKVHCTTLFRMAYTNYIVDKQTIHAHQETEFHSHASAMHTEGDTHPPHDSMTYNATTCVSI